MLRSILGPPNTSPTRQVVTGSTSAVFSGCTTKPGYLGPCRHHVDAGLVRVGRKAWCSETRKRLRRHREGAAFGNSVAPERLVVDLHRATQVREHLAQLG